MSVDELIDDDSWSSIVQLKQTEELGKYLLCVMGIVSHRSAVCADSEDNENKIPFFLLH